MLEVHKLNAHYGKSHVLAGVDLAVGDGELVSVLGRNGSGRSTLIKSIMGLVPPSAGSVRLDGVEIAGLAPYRIARAGIAYVPEERLVFDNVTVEENLVAGMQTTGPGRARWTIEQMYEYFPRLRERRATKGGNLSGGEQQMLTLCRSLLGNPRLIMIDEPTEGLAPLVVEALVKFIIDINRRGVGVILVEQKMTIALRIAHRVLIMGHGRIVFEGSPEELRSHPTVRRQWLEAA
jgi:branched-chain amino acid transport system ATP-binding protein